MGENLASAAAAPMGYPFRWRRRAQTPYSPFDLQAVVHAHAEHGTGTSALKSFVKPIIECLGIRDRILATPVVISDLAERLCVCLSAVWRRGAWWLVLLLCFCLCFISVRVS